MEELITTYFGVPNSNRAKINLLKSSAFEFGRLLDDAVMKSWVSADKVNITDDSSVAWLHLHI